MILDRFLKERSLRFLDEMEPRSLKTLIAGKKKMTGLKNKIH